MWPPVNCLVNLFVCLLCVCLLCVGLFTLCCCLFDYCCMLIVFSTISLCTASAFEASTTAPHNNSSFWQLAFNAEASAAQVHKCVSAIDYPLPISLHS